MPFCTWFRIHPQRKKLAPLALNRIIPITGILTYWKWLKLKRRCWKTNRYLGDFHHDLKLRKFHILFNFHCPLIWGKIDKNWTDHKQFNVFNRPTSYVARTSQMQRSWLALHSAPSQNTKGSINRSLSVKIPWAPKVFFFFLLNFW